MELNEIRLKLMEMAEELDGVEVDNGPIGSYHPHGDKAQRLRRLAMELKKVSTSSGTGDFRDEPWEPR
jgi:hypothetical protein